MKRVVFFIMILLMGCVPPRNRDGCHQIIYVVNETERDVVFYFTAEEKIYNMPAYETNEWFVNAKSKTKYISYLGCYESDFGLGCKDCPKLDTCYFFLWYKDELDVLPSDMIWTYNLYSCRIDLTLEQLDSLAWTITIKEGMLKSILPSLESSEGSE